MKFICTRLDLNEAVSVVSRVAKSNCLNLGFSSAIFMTAENGTLTLRGYDGEMGVERSIPCNVSKEGMALVDAKIFGEIIKKLNEGEVAVELKDKSVHITSGKTKMRVACGDPSVFPQFPSIENPQTVTLKGGALKDILSRVLFAVSKDTSRLMLTGVFLKCENGVLTAVSCDGFRLAMNTVSVEGADDFKVIMPSKTVGEVMRSIGTAETDVSVILGANQINFVIDDTKLTSKVISGEYINYEAIFNGKKPVTKVVVNRDELYDAIDRALLVASSEGDKPKPFSMAFSEKNGTITVSCETSVSNTNDVIATEKCKGDDITLFLNAKYNLEALKAIEDESVIISFCGKQAPMIITPTNSTAYLHLILPIRE